MAQTLTLETHGHPPRAPSLEPAHCFPLDLFTADADPADELDDDEDDDEDEDEDEDDEVEEELDKEDSEDEDSEDDEEELEEEGDLEEAGPAHASMRRQNGHAYTRPTSRR